MEESAAIVAETQSGTVADISVTETPFNRVFEVRNWIP